MLQKHIVLYAHIRCIVGYAPMYKYTACIFFWPIVHKRKWKHTTALVLVPWWLKHRMGDLVKFS